MRKGPRPQQPDDSEASSTKEKGNPTATPATNGKGRRVANSAANANASGTKGTNGTNGTPATSGAAGGTNAEGNVGV